MVHVFLFRIFFSVCFGFDDLSSLRFSIEAARVLFKGLGLSSGRPRLKSRESKHEISKKFYFFLSWFYSPLSKQTLFSKNSRNWIIITFSDLSYNGGKLKILL